MNVEHRQFQPSYYLERTSTFTSIFSKTTAAWNIDFVYLPFKRNLENVKQYEFFHPGNYRGQDREFPTNSAWLPGTELMESVLSRILKASIWLTWYPSRFWAGLQWVSFVPPIVYLERSWLPSHDTRLPHIIYGGRYGVFPSKNNVSWLVCGYRSSVSWWDSHCRTFGWPLELWRWQYLLSHWYDLSIYLSPWESIFEQLRFYLYMFFFQLQVLLPPWPMFNRHPVKWLPSVDTKAKSEWEINTVHRVSAPLSVGEFR